MMLAKLIATLPTSSSPRRHAHDGETSAAHAPQQRLDHRQPALEIAPLANARPRRASVESLTPPHGQAMRDYLLRFADLDSTLMASLRPGFDFDRSSPMLLTLAIMAVCSSAGSE